MSFKQFVNDEDEEEINFETLHIENSKENEESEINAKDKETVTLYDPITNETKEVPVKSNKNVKN